MATSEYLSHGGHPAPGSLLEIPGSARRSRFGADVGVSAALMTGDVACILMACGFAFAARMYWLPMTPYLRDAPLAKPFPSLLYACFFALAYLLVARRYGLYSLQATTGGHETRRVIQGCMTAGLLLCGILYLSRAEIVSRLLVIFLVVSATGTLCLWRSWWRYSRGRDCEDGVEARNVVILGTNRLSYALSRQVQHLRGIGYCFLGFIETPGTPVSAEIPANEILGGVEDIRELVRQHFVDELVIADFLPTESAMRLVQQARALDIDVRAIAGFYGDLTTHAPVEYLGIFPVASLHRRDAQGIGFLFKRAGDFLLAALLLAVTSPLMVAIAFAVKLESAGPVFYLSERVGRRGRKFRCFKIRTMVDDAERLQKELAELNERDGVLFKVANDPRVTPLGRILRRYSLDEVPQFLNVLRGEMSLVGPRPPVAAEVEQYELDHLRRLEVLPGMTGLWQVKARRDPSFARYIALDMAYVENWSLWLDLKILLETARVVVAGTGT